MKHGVAVAAAALLFTLLALELPAIVGWVDYRQSVGTAERIREPKPYPTQTDIREHNKGDLISYYGLPNGAPRDISFRTDRYGFRNATDLERAAVVVLGDSFVLNATVPEPQLFTTMLGRQLGFAVANVSHSGWGPHDELGALRRVGLTLQPRLALWVFYEGNDIADTIVYGGRDIDWSERLFVSSAYLRLAALAERVLFGETRRNYSWGNSGQPFGSCTLPCSHPPCQRMYFGNLAGPLSLFEEVALRRVFEVLDHANTETRQRGVSLIVIYAPVALRVYHQVCTFLDDSPARNSAVNDLPERMRRWTSSQGIGFVDLTPALTAAAANGELIYYLDDTHWTAAGNAVVANALASQGVIRNALAAGR